MIQEASLREREPAESEKSAGSLTHISEPSRTHFAPPSATSPDGRKRKRQSDEEDLGTSKLVADVPEETSQGQTFAFNPFDAALGMSS
jgi:hypothetical protein